jgi:hypothetical protein
VVAANDRNVILKLVIALRIEGMPSRRCTAVKRRQNLKSIAQRIWRAFIVRAGILVPDLVDHIFGKHGRLRRLNRMSRCRSANTSGNQIEAADSGKRDIHMR